jgi:hypothetical protein
MHSVLLAEIALRKQAVAAHTLHAITVSIYLLLLLYNLIGCHVLHRRC